MSKGSVVVIDNGAGLCKAGFGGDRDPVAIVPNCVAKSPASKKWLVADELRAADTDVTSVSLRRPFDRGYLVNPELQREVWDRVIRTLLRVDPNHSSLLLVEPLFNPPSVQRVTDEIVFEDFGFRSLCVADSPSLVHLFEASRGHSHCHQTQCSLVVDCGFSFTHAAPVLQNFTLNYAVKRLDLGGKVLTNYLKELVSYRSVNVMDETLIIDHAKEKLCFVSLDVSRDLRLARRSGKQNPFKCTYVLPDGIEHTKGYVKDFDEAQRYLSLPYETLPTVSGQKEELTLSPSNLEKPEQRMKVDLLQNEFTLTNERFLVPEMLFHPADLGMNQAGLAECIVRAVNSCHPLLHPVLYESILLTGGSTLFPRFAERLKMELRPLVPDDYQVKITSQEDPILGIWRGGSLLASSPDFESMCVSKSDYEELGSTRCRRRFFH
ncbi:actin-related protein 6-like isoform X1 [Zingiber officinale]|uniref:actin-related protein 6-like isoform X1 n=1 Tax=Zingiber officinale TaxID=94328 RepID=UPI001C4C4A72|nr:actin-related protein 6-like isoform X1 [Zingiber officinale]XP_042436502.1 actin-related protein 6-like isoform X1 [Zingiber officinale]XP_042438866.1 actin-related protein 6-like isoform X1 [Zingiber officinale]XP_042438867.1 actin-related protein 6-like isoform X1 [Zingiber officinale]